MKVRILWKDMIEADEPTYALLQDLLWNHGMKASLCHFE